MGKSELSVKLDETLRKEGGRENRERLRLEWSHDSSTDITTFFEAALQIRKKETRA